MEEDIDFSGLVMPIEMNSLPTADDSVNPNVARAIFTTTTAINLLSAMLSSMNIPAPKIPTLSGFRKCPLSSLSPDITDQSLLFSLAGLPPSTISYHSPFIYTTKYSHHSSSDKAVASSSHKNMTSVALHAVDSSIQHLSDTFNNNFIDPLKSTVSATSLLYSHTGMSDEHQHFLTMQMTLNPTITVVLYTSLSDDTSRLNYSC
ncbi:hypothetical protein J3R82DRAFT_7799 [Butyriboletus roseoflavus]|nr:hypothetical protein J3R82DRAFT_7799 [Butyriboletus roseoflavus]